MTQMYHVAMPLDPVTAARLLQHMTPTTLAYRGTDAAHVVWARYGNHVVTVNSWRASPNVAAMLRQPATAVYFSVCTLVKTYINVVFSYT